MNSNDNKKDVVLIIDALNLFTRHYVAHPALGANGQHVGGIVGFLYAITKFAEDFKQWHGKAYGEVTAFGMDWWFEEKERAKQAHNKE